MPEKPAYSLVVTTIFSNQTNVIEDTSFKAEMTALVKDYLEGKGYKAVIVNDHKDMTTDLNISLQPVAVYDMPLTDHGYGFHLKYLMGTELMAVVFASIRLDVTQSGVIRTLGYFNKELFSTDVEDLPKTWNELSEGKERLFEKTWLALLRECYWLTYPVWEFNVVGIPIKVSLVPTLTAAHKFLIFNVDLHYVASGDMLRYLNHQACGHGGWFGAGCS